MKWTALQHAGARTENADWTSRGGKTAASLSRTAQKCDQPAMNLINSLDDHVDADTETLWLQEAERRYHEYREGRTKGRSADDAFANLLRMKIQVHPVDTFFLDKERHSHDMPDCKYKGGG